MIKSWLSEAFVPNPHTLVGNQPVSDPVNLDVQDTLRT